MPSDFPTGSFERVYTRVKVARGTTHAAIFEHFNGAWNAISLRFLTMVAEGDAFTISIDAPDGRATVEQRFQQESHLFGFFGNGFSAFEAFFYGLFAIGSSLRSADFPLATPKEQQAVSPASTTRAYTQAFTNDPILAALRGAQVDTAYQEWKEIRNVLTHRTAPGRTFFVSIGFDEDLPTRWKLNNIPLDGQTTSTRRAHAARMLSVLLDAAVVFTEARFT